MSDLIGTPLVEEKSRHQPPELHGAFSGGFSAGYYNTVGSAEGFTPRSFHSTQSNRARPTDDLDQYMDAEDRYSYEEKIKLSRVEQNIGSSQSMLDLLLSNSDSLNLNESNYQGYKIMQHMGWRPGQGLGPPELRETNLLSGEKRLFQYTPRISSSIKNGDSDTFDYNFKFYGLGYDVELPEVTSAKPLQPQRKKKRVAMNLSIAGDLDEDEDEDSIVFPRKKRGVLGAVKFKPKRVSKPIMPSFTSSDKFLDGSPVPAEFLLSNLKLFNQVHYIAPSDIEVPSSPLPGPSPSGPSPSVFSFMTATHRNRLATITGNSDLPAAGPSLELIPELPKNIALAALNNSSLPYGGDLPKQARYVAYLQDQAGIKPEIKQERELGVGSLGEILEFVRVATIFRPLTGAIAQRFVSETSSNGIKPCGIKEEPGGKQEPGAKQEPRIKQELGVKQEFEDEQDNKSTILSSKKDPKYYAQMGQFGPDTCTVQQWLPSRLLAKRVGVPYKSIKDAESLEQQSSEASLPNNRSNGISTALLKSVYGDSEGEQ